MPKKIYFFTLLLLFISASSCSHSSSKKKQNEETTSPLSFGDPNYLSSILQKEAEAKRKSDPLALAFAYHDKVNYFNFVYNKDSALFYAQEGSLQLEIFKDKTPRPNKEQSESYELLKRNFVTLTINHYLSTNKYDLALIYLQKIANEEVYGNQSVSYDAQIHYFLGVTYLLSKKDEKALELFKKSYELSRKATDKRPYDFYLSFKGMAHALLGLKRYEEVVAINDSVLVMIDNEQEILGKKEYVYYLIKYALCFESASAYIKTGDLKKARTLLDEAQVILAEHIKDAPQRLAHYQVESQYYLAKKDYVRANEYLKIVASDIGGIEEGGIYNYLEVNMQKAIIMRQAGEEAEAYDLLYKLYELNDSTNVANFSSQVAEIESIYQVDKMKLEAVRNQETLRKMWFFIISGTFITLLLAYILFSYIRNAQKLKEKNLQLYKKYSELERNNQEIIELKKKNERLLSLDAESEDPYDQIINDLNNYLLEFGAFKKPNVSREELALAIGTNRQYLIEAIKLKTGKTYNEYIYTYRLKYAFDSIVRDKDKKIAEIYLEAGFLSNATFYRVFKEHYGMTPSELRNVL